jgi:hypothetical protein
MRRITTSITSFGDAKSPHRSLVSGHRAAHVALAKPGEVDMTITTTKLTRAAGLAAVMAGLLFVIQLIHPHEALANQAPQYVDGFLATFTGAVTGGLGYSLWRDQRTSSPASASSVPKVRFDPAGVQ